LVNKTIERLSSALDEQAHNLAVLDGYYEGTQPASFLSEKAREALGKGFRNLGVNFPRLVVNSIAERLRVTGFRTPAGVDTDLWDLWNRYDLDEAAAQCHTEALALGRCFVIVWADKDGNPVVTVESARQVAVQRDPATREVTAAFKRWVADGKAHGVFFERDRITRVRSLGNTPSEGSIPASGWETVEVLDNPLGVVPVVPFVNRGRITDLDGVSEMQDILALTDAVNKVSSDALVTSEYYARPRRWATGLEVQEDDEGNPINPFQEGPDRVWQSEAPDTKFGQFAGSSLDGYGDLLATLTQQIGALAGLPPHYLGLNGDQPPSADSIRSAEASLVATAFARQRTFGAAWARVAALVIAIRDGVDPLRVRVETVWASPETRTPAQAADAAAKLREIGVPLAFILEHTLGFSPADVEQVRALARAEALDSAGVDIEAILP
jgi:hypothetical protein